MKILHISITRVLSRSVVAFAVILLATQGTVSAQTARLAVENANQDANSLLGKMDQELTRRSGELQQSSLALNGETQDGAANSTGVDAEKCANGDAEMTRAINKVNKDSAEASSNIQKLQSDAKKGTDTKKSATATDAQYDEYRQANFQNRAMNNICTQKDAQVQVQALVQQTTDRYNECFGGDLDLSQNQDWTKLTGDSAKTQSAEKTSQQGADCSSQAGQQGGQGGGGGGSIDIKEIITKVIQLLIAVAAIIASVVALIQAIQKGDWAAVASIAETIIGQLAAAANILVDAFTQLTEASGGMEGGDSSSGGSQGSGNSGGNSNSGSNSGSTSNSANLLPVGDGKHTTASAKKGYVFTCSQYAQRLSSGRGGADKRGPWFVNNNTQYDPSKKPHVQGQVRWNGSMTNTVSGSTRTIRTNDVPKNHTTGKFPIASSDPAYQYDRNPNGIKEQSLVYSLASNPTPGDPRCMGHDVGVMLTGVVMFNALDERGRDAGAWETQDACEGHPEVTSKYHYHTLSDCIEDVKADTVIGFALDGFPITGPKTDDKVLKTNDLDECHGTTSSIVLDGKRTNMYHYVMTRDFPYSVSCFRAAPVRSPTL